jgi:alpha-ketoglutarate-dependent taurine dioxygenase
MNAVYTNVPDSSPFSLGNDQAYQAWRDRKLQQYPESPEELLVQVVDPANPDSTESQQMLGILRKTNMVIYRCKGVARADKEIPRKLGHHFGLERLDPNLLADDDGITSLELVAGKSLRGYIPYSNRRLQWHTDGYYNTPDRQIRAFILHCVRPALQGGENGLIDHELVYIRLRDENPDYIRALMQADVMTIPANEEDSSAGRVEQPGPVFSVEPATGCLHMRYTARTRSIVWADDEASRAAVAALQDILAAEDGVFHYKLGPGEGLICNNVLHSRTAFVNGNNESEQRLMYRARYYDRIRDTGMMA